jgi:C1A family cysteine protease
MGIEVGQDFLYPAPDGFIAVPDLQAQAAGYHAVLLVGAWTDPVYGRVFLVRNSWGVHWGAGGYGLLPVDYLVNFGTQAAKVEI